MASAAGAIRVGVGGWDYDPWRETFYPKGLSRAKQLEFASRRLTAIEINATYYKLQKPELFEKWCGMAPDGFRFAIKGSRFCSNRRVLGEAGEAIERFFGQGLAELGDKLGPILWQFMTTKQFDPDDFAAFLALLPARVGGVPLVHAVEPRHESFRTPVFVELARKAGVAIVFADSDEHPCLAEVSGPIAYARLQRSRADQPAGYPPEELDRWAEVARGWSRGEAPPGLPTCSPPAPPGPRDTYVFFISGAKERNPAAAMAVIERLS
ncbi:MAG: hypothetical protein QOJ94_959 [Sphingomonadales bacterium]|jgi:uncharacterized protein YecE (DUF72 family)|nr:hypothetical protein [Sphingomonadales bacterium]